MNQFKSIFLGTVNPNSDFAQLKSAVNSQKASHLEIDHFEFLLIYIYSVYVQVESIMSVVTYLDCEFYLMFAFRIWMMLERTATTT